MSEARPDEQATASVSVQQRVDAAWLRFEDAWKAGQFPRLEDFLDEALPAERALLLRELLRLELDYRRRRGDQPGAEEYKRRFPEQVGRRSS
jgi:serine/threonine-protein kinase